MKIAGLFLSLVLATGVEAQNMEPTNFVGGTLASDVTNTDSTLLVAAAGANVRTYLTQLTVTNNDAAVGTVVKILDGSTTKFRAYAKEAGGGFSITFPTPLRGSANTAWNIQAETTSAQIQAVAVGYKSTR